MRSGSRAATVLDIPNGQGKERQANQNNRVKPARHQHAQGIAAVPVQINNQVLGRLGNKTSVTRAMRACANGVVAVSNV